MSLWRRWFGVGVAIAALASLWGATASAQTLNGQVVYRGFRGPVSPQRPIALLLFSDSALENPRAGDLVTVDNGTFSLAPGPGGTYYLFFSLAPGGTVRVGEPYQIYENRSAPPGLPIVVPTANLSLLLDDRYLLPGIAGTVTYDGTGSVSAGRPLVVVFSRSSEFTTPVTSIAVTQNGGRYDLPRFDSGPYYVAAFYDANGNDSRDSNEPLQVYRNRAQSPGDPVVPGIAQQSIDFNLADVPPTPTVPRDTPTPTRTATATATATPTTTATPTPTLSATATPSPTPTNTRRKVSTPGPCVGDCDGNGTISIAELIRGVGIALGTVPYDACRVFDANRNGRVEISEIIRGVNGALDGCIALTPTP